MIRTMEIPREMWPAFFKLIDKFLQGRAIQLEEIGLDVGDQELTNVVPFEGLDFEPRGSDAGALTLHAGLDDASMDHRMFHPTQVFVGVNDAADLEWLAIEHEEGGKTLVHFRELPKLEPVYPN